MITDKDVTRVMALANKVGASFSRSYPGIAAEDISQESLVGFLDRVKDLDGKNDAWITTILERTAKKYCNKERADYMYYSCSYVYSPKDVRALLEVAFTSGYDSHSTPQKGDKDNVLDAGSVVISVFDLLTALGQLRTNQVEILTKKHTGYELSDAELRQYYRAVDGLTGLLNRHLNSKERLRSHGGPGSRRAISNAKAQAITHNQWDD